MNTLSPKEKKIYLRKRYKKLEQKYEQKEEQRKRVNKNMSFYCFSNDCCNSKYKSHGIDIG